MILESERHRFDVRLPPRQVIRLIPQPYRYLRAILIKVSLFLNAHLSMDHASEIKKILLNNHLSNLIVFLLVLLC